MMIKIMIITILKVTIVILLMLMKKCCAAGFCFQTFLSG